MAIVTEEKGVVPEEGAERVCARGSILTDRVKKLKEVGRATTRGISVERARIVTDYFKKADPLKPIALRRAEAFDEVLSKKSIYILDDELIVGSQAERVRCGNLYPEYDVEWLVSEYDLSTDRETYKLDINPEDRKVIAEVYDFWKDKTTRARSLKLWREKWGSWPIDAHEDGLIYIDTPGSVAAGRRISDYPKVLNKGLRGVIVEAKEELKKLDITTSDDIDKKFFLEAVVISCNAVIKFARRYARLAKELAEKESNPRRKTELEKLSEICEWVPANPARTYHEALQSFWFTHVALEIENCFNGYSPGRFDQYMYPFYKKDVEEGRITREEAGELLACLFVKHMEVVEAKSVRYTHVVSSTMAQHVTIGGQTEDGKNAVNDMSYLILDVTEDLMQTQPTISVRYFDGLPERFLHRAAEVVKLGTGMPAWFNDKVTIPTMLSLGVPIKEARNWAPTGCVEAAVSYCSPLMSGSGSINLTKLLELVLNNGVDPRNKKQLGLKTGDAISFTSYDELIDAFQRQLTYTMRRSCEARNMRFALHRSMAPNAFASSLINDCIKNGKDICAGGARYRWGLTFFPFGFQDAGNSLAAIKKLVFEEKKISMQELLDTLEANFEGKEEIHKMLLDSPKFGNDDDYVDYIVNDLYQMCMQTAPQFNNALGEPAICAFLGITYHHFFGIVTGALPEGRKAYTYLADGTLSPVQGQDRKGPTAVLNSAGKIDSVGSLSTLTNQKFSPAVLKGREGTIRFVNYIKTWADKLIYHIQFNVVSKETLLAAQREPEKYRDLVIRVAGFSVYWIDVARYVQDEIIARAEQEF